MRLCVLLRFPLFLTTLLVVRGNLECAMLDWYQDGYCDIGEDGYNNNVASCDYDGGDCCETTCGVGYSTNFSCGATGYSCIDPTATQDQPSSMPTQQPTTTMTAITTSNIGAAVSAWISDPTTAIPIYGDISTWDTSSVTNMGHLFEDQGTFNGNIASWNTAKVTTMESMFLGASVFNGNIASWNTAKVTHMGNMMCWAPAFNGNVASWNTASVTTMESMFGSASSFNGNIATWNTASVINMWQMFNGASSFTGNIALWNTASVTNMHKMFLEASIFNVDISSWNVASVTDMQQMFYYAVSFNQDLCWDIPSETNTNNMFWGSSGSIDCTLTTTTITDGNIGIAVAAWIDDPTTAATTYGDISTWDTSAVTNMASLFSGKSTFNGNIAAWNTASVTDFSWLFYEAMAFNGDISSWNTASVTDMNCMFCSAYTFNGNLASWDTTSVANMWQLFYNAYIFNGNLALWNTASVTNMHKMFWAASTFNIDLSEWNVAQVTDMQEMYYYATSFDQKLCWNISSGTVTTNMFLGSSGSIACSSCPAGTYRSGSFGSCLACPAGYYCPYASSTYSACSSGYFSTTGASSCAGTIHDFDFRGCTTGMAVRDAFSYTATPYNGAACSSDGMHFDGVDDYLLLTNWNWGSATSFETFVSFLSFFSHYSRIFDFGNGAASSNVLLAHVELSSSVALHIYSDSSSANFELLNFWTVGAYVHAVATVTSSGNMALYKNGELVGSFAGYSPAELTRSYHYVGRSCWSGDGYFYGFIAYLRIYNSLALSATDASTLYDRRYNCKAGMYGSGGSCSNCLAGYYSTSGSSSCEYLNDHSQAVGSYAQLVKAIDNSNSTVTFSADIIADDQIGINSKSSIIIDGTGRSLSAHGFYINNCSNVKISNIIFSNINNDRALLIVKSSILLDTVSMVSIDCYSWGGAINAVYSSIKLVNVTITDVYSVVATIFIEMSDLSIFNSNIHECLTSDFGGAIECKQSNLYISSSSFIGNTAGNPGGAISCLDGSVCTVFDSTFEYNTCSYNGGGAVYSYGSIFNVSNSIFTGNSARFGASLYLYQSSVSLFKVSIQDNIANEHSGGIYAFNSSLTITGSIVANNKALTGVGGGLAAIDCILMIADSIVSNNQADSNVGGGILASEGTIAVLTSSAIVGNRAKAAGGIYAASGSMILTACNISNNQASLAEESVGGGIYSSNVFLNITSSFISNNFAVYGAGVCSDKVELFITDSDIIGNTAVLHGGGLFALGDDNTGSMFPTTLTRVNILHNAIIGYESEGTSGGGVKLEFSKLSLSKCNFASNKLPFDLAAPGVGGGLFMEYTVADMSEIEFTKNEALFASAFYGASSKVVIDSIIFSDNEAGIAAVVNQKSSFKISHYKFDGNIATAKFAADLYTRPEDQEKLHVPQGVDFFYDGAANFSFSYGHTNAISGNFSYAYSNFSFGHVDQYQMELSTGCGEGFFNSGEGKIDCGGGHCGLLDSAPANVLDSECEPCGGEVLNYGFICKNTDVPTQQPTLSPTTGDTVTVVVTVEISTSQATISAAETEFLLHAVEKSIGFNISDFTVSIEAARRRLGTERHLASYTWILSFRVVTRLSQVNPNLATTTSDVAALVETRVTSDLAVNIQSSMSLAVVVAEVSTVAQTRSPSPQPTLLAYCSAGEYNIDRTCLSCPGGKYQPIYGPVPLYCSNCAAGLTSTNHSSSCSACPVGRYAREIASPVCSSCLSGNYASKTGSSSCIVCAVGYFSYDEANNCSKCAAGYYASSNETVTCDSCIGGKYSAMGQSSCSLCAAGKYSSNVQEACTVCSNGYYSLVAYETCAKCAGGRHSSIDFSSCETCSPGQYSSQGGDCVDCPSGYYAPQPLADQCSPCLSGSYATGNALYGATQCTFCASGLYSLGLTTSCSKCASGQFSTPGSFECISCPTGTYTSSEGSSSCKDCIGNLYSRLGATVCNRCLKNFYNAETSDSTVAVCNKCPLGSECLIDGASSSSQLTLSPKYWRISAHSVDLRDCKLSPKACVGSATFSDGGNSYCGVGYSGPLCAVCSSGYYFSGDSKRCESCGSESTQFSAKVMASPSILIFLGVFLVVILGVISSILPMRRMLLAQTKPPDSFVNRLAGKDSPFENRDGSVTLKSIRKVKYEQESHFVTSTNVSSVAVVVVKTTKTIAETEFMKKSKINIKASNSLIALFGLMKQSSVKVKSLAAFGQISVNMGFTCHIVFPSIYSKFLNSLNFVNLDMVSSLGLNCKFLNFSYIDKMIVMTASPIIVTAILFLVYLFISYYVDAAESDSNLLKIYPEPTEFPPFTHEDMMRHRRAFHHCDADSGGTIDKEEMTKIVREYNSDDMSDDEIKAQVEEFFKNDADESGEIDFGEFLEALKSSQDPDVFFTLNELQKKAAHSHGESIFNLFLLLSFLVLVSSSSVVFNYFQCDSFQIPDEDGGGNHKYLFKDYSVDCSSSEYKNFLAYAVLMILIYPIGIPLFYGSILYEQRVKLRDENFMKQEESNGYPTLGHLKFLVSSYRPAYYWYEVLECVRRILLGSAIGLVAVDSAASAVVGYVLALLFCYAIVKSQPFKNTSDSNLVMILSHSLIFLYLGAIMVKVDITKDFDEMFGAVLCSILCSGPLYAVTHGFGVWGTLFTLHEVMKKDDSDDEEEKEADGAGGANENAPESE